MKKIILLLLIPCFVKAQKKKDNTFVLPAVSYSQIKQVLFKNGFVLNNNDTTLISTSEIAVPKETMSIKLFIERTDTATYIKAQYIERLQISLGVVTNVNGFETLYYKGKGNNYFTKPWNEVDRIAKEISTNILYSRR